MMALIDRYRNLYDHEKDCNSKMLAMIDSVPEARREDKRFARALAVAGHLAAGRENWLARLTAQGEHQRDWWPREVEPASLPARFAALENAWTEYLDRLADADLDVEFGFPTKDGGWFSFRKGILIEQLVGHAAYHRGQVALLVDQLGGETVDTDYLQWALGPK
jgi:uncharacterized damage-inducible protein DinB